MERPPLFSKARKLLFLASLALSLSLHAGGLYLLVKYSSLFLNVRSLEHQYQKDLSTAGALLGTHLALSNLPNDSVPSPPHLSVESADPCADLITSFDLTSEKFFDFLLSSCEHSPSLHFEKRGMTQSRISLECPPLAEPKEKNKLPTISHSAPVREKARDAVISISHLKQIEMDVHKDFKKHPPDEQQLKTTPLSIMPFKRTVKEQNRGNVPRSEAVELSNGIDKLSKQTLIFAHPVETHSPKKERRKVEERARLDVISNCLAPFSEWGTQLETYASISSDHLLCSPLPTDELPLSFELCSTNLRPPLDPLKRFTLSPILFSINIDHLMSPASSPSCFAEEMTEGLARVNNSDPMWEKIPFKTKITSQQHLIQQITVLTPKFFYLPQTSHPLVLPPWGPLTQHHLALPIRACFNLSPLTHVMHTKMRPNDELMTTPPEVREEPFIQYQQKKEGKHWLTHQPLIARDVEIGDHNNCSLDLFTSLAPPSLSSLSILPEKFHLRRMPSSITLRHWSGKIQAQRNDFFNIVSPYFPCKELPHTHIHAEIIGPRYLDALPSNVKEGGAQVPLTFNELKAPHSPFLEIIELRKSPIFSSKKMDFLSERRHLLAPLRFTEIAREGTFVDSTHTPFLTREEEEKPPDLCWERRKRPLVIGQKKDALREGSRFTWTGRDEALSFIPPLHAPCVFDAPVVKNRYWQTKNSIQVLPSEVPKIGQSHSISKITHNMFTLEKETADRYHPHWVFKTPRLLASRKQGPQTEKNDVVVSISCVLTPHPAVQIQASDLQKTMHIPGNSIGKIPTIDRLTALEVESLEVDEVRTALLKQEEVKERLTQLISNKELRALKPQISDLESQEMHTYPLQSPPTQTVTMSLFCSNSSPTLGAQKAYDLNRVHRLTGGHFFKTIEPRDFKMAAFQNDFETTVTYVENPDSNGYHFSLHIQPNEKLGFATPKQNFIFILDCSGTIKEHRYNTFKEALIKAIPYMNEGDSFNIVLTDSKIMPMSEKPLVWDKRIIHDVRAYLDKCEYRGYFANKNGFHLLAEMGKFFDASRENVVVLLTDGQSFKTIKKHKDAFRQLAERSRGVFSLFTASASQNNNTTMLGLVSSFNNGEFMYSSTHAAFPRKLAIFIKHIKHLVARNIHLQAVVKNEAKIHLYPRQAAYPPFFADRPYIVYGSIDKLEDFDLILQGNLKTEWIHIKQHISFEDAKKAGHELKRNCALQKAYACYADYLQKNDPYLVEEAETILKHYELHSNIR